MNKIFDDPKSVFILEGSYDKSNLIHRLVEYALNAGIVKDLSATYQAILKRESLGSTGIGDGVAIPHTKLESVEGVNVVFFYLPNGVDFEAVDNNKVYYVFLILSHEKETVLHLKVLAAIAKLIKNTDFLNSINSNATASQIHSILNRCWSEVV